MSKKKQTIYLYERNGRFVIDGTSAVELDAVEDVQLGSNLHVVDRKRIEKKQRNRFLRTAVTYMVMAVIVLMATNALFHYINLQQRLTTTIQEVGSLEAEAASLETSNDQRLADIQSSINLDEIRRRAIMELGMSYAEQGQIITYSAERANTVNQFIVVD